MIDPKQDWREKLEAQFADMFNLVEVQVGVSERENLFNFIAQEIKTAEERERREVIEELEKIKQWPEPKTVAEMKALVMGGMYMQYKFDTDKHEEQIEKIIAKFNL